MSSKHRDKVFEEKEQDFISLTDIAKKFNERAGQLIINWLRTRSTVNFLGTWEMLYNPSFNVLNFEDIKSQTGQAFEFLSFLSPTFKFYVFNASKK